MVGRGGRTAVTLVLLPRQAGGSTPRSICRLDDDEAHHLRVRRVSAGETVGIRDGAGLMGSGTVIRDGKVWAVEIVSAESRPRPPELALAVGAGDRDRFTSLVERAAELGVSVVIPVETARTAGVASGLRSRHVARLRRQALEVVKQSGAAWAVAVEEPVSLDRFLGTRRSGVTWLADAEGEPPPASLSSEPVTVLVGPEGGLTGAEREAAARAGYHPVRLGPHTLRFETAALAAAAAVNLARLRGTDE
jgi:16S rRNA (uracil1498-N3)-methyltransferase